MNRVALLALTLLLLAGPASARVTPEQRAAEEQLRASGLLVHLEGTTLTLYALDQVSLTPLGIDVAGVQVARREAGGRWAQLRGAKVTLSNLDLARAYVPATLA